MEVSVLLDEPNMSNQEPNSDHVSDLPSAQSSSSFSLLVSIVLEMIPSQFYSFGDVNYVFVLPQRLV